MVRYETRRFIALTDILDFSFWDKQQSHKDAFGQAKMSKKQLQ